MIRINLIAASKGKRRVRPGMPDIPNVGVLLFVLLLVIESAVLYSMHASATDEAQRFTRKVKRVKRDLESAKKIHAQLTAVRKEVGRLRTQALLFEELEAEKKGPVGALSFLSFILKPRDQTSHSAKELTQMEAADWRVDWDANRAWFTYFRAEQGEVTLRGAAIHHDDVAEVLRRLESSAHYRNVRLVWQERRRHRQLHKDFIVFTLKSDLIYLVQPYLTAEQRAAKEAAAAERKAMDAEKEKAGGKNQAEETDEPAVPVPVAGKPPTGEPVIIDEPLNPPTPSTLTTEAPAAATETAETETDAPESPESEAATPANDSPENPAEVQP